MGMFTVTPTQRRLLVALGVCAALLVLPATAAAQDALSNPSAAQYAPQSQVQGSSGNGPTANNSPATPAAATPAAAPTATEGASGTLPFTGMDLAVVGGVALMLIASGLGLRWLSAPRSPVI
jgi:hypothetical protein